MLALIVFHSEELFVYLMICISGTVHCITYSQQMNLTTSFYRCQADDVDLEPRHLSWNDRSIIACWQTSKRVFPNVRSFKFNSETRQCTPGLYFTAANQQRSPADDIYIKLECDTDNGFQLKQIGSTMACLRVFEEPANYSEADASCGRQQAFLMSVKTVDKLKMINNFTFDLWVGADDIKTEGVFVWREDTTVMTDDVVREVFTPTEPNNQGNEDCVQYRRYTNALNDQDCSDQIFFVCEQRID